MSDRLNLFLLEDEDDVALLMRRALERAGHKVTHCRTAADALMVLGHGGFDLALLDQVLPDMSGVDLVQKLADDNITVPILMVTARGNEGVAAQALKAGVLDYVAKGDGIAFLAELPKRVSESVQKHRLQQFNRLLVQALESARDGILITDPAGHIVHVNQALESLTGYRREELLGKKPNLLKSGVHPPALYEQMWETILSRRSWQGELTNRRKDGSHFEISLAISPILDAQGRLTHFVGIYRDVTAHKQLQRQLLQAQKMQSVGTLAGGVAHEFNNLLAGINGYASLALREPELPGAVREFLHCIVDLSERAAVLTRQLLAFARKPALSRRPTSMSDLVRATADLVTRTLHLEVRVEVQETTPTGEPLVVEADFNQLQQALINLALNARDALRDPQVQARAAGRAVPVIFRVFGSVLTVERPAFPQGIPSGDYVVVQVEDQGCGMSAEVLNQALDPFFTTKEVGQGTGLGLPVVFGIVQGHMGYLTIDSTPGVGTCMSLYLPRYPMGSLIIADNGAARRTEEPVSEPGRSILVVDDEEAVLDIVCRFLRIAGHQATPCTSGRKALELITAGLKVDLIVLDLMMPEEIGSVTFQRLRECRPDLPVLLCTGLMRDDEVGDLLDSAAGLLRKPFRMTELWEAVRLATRER